MSCFKRRNSDFTSKNHFSLMEVKDVKTPLSNNVLGYSSLLTQEILSNIYTVVVNFIFLEFFKLYEVNISDPVNQ